MKHASVPQLTLGFLVELQSSRLARPEVGPLPITPGCGFQGGSVSSVPVGLRHDARFPTLWPGFEFWLARPFCCCLPKGAKPFLPLAVFVLDTLPKTSLIPAPCLPILQQKKFPPLQQQSLELTTFEWWTNRICHYTTAASFLAWWTYVVIGQQ